MFKHSIKSVISMTLAFGLIGFAGANLAHAQGAERDQVQMQKQIQQRNREAAHARTANERQGGRQAPRQAEAPAQRQGAGQGAGQGRGRN